MVCDRALGGVRLVAGPRRARPGGSGANAVREDRAASRSGKCWCCVGYGEMMQLEGVCWRG